MAVLGSACKSGNAKSPPTSAAAPTASATSLPPATPTPDPLARAPRDAADAEQLLTAAIAIPGAGLCPAGLRSEWAALCLAGDFDGDTRQDAAYLVPLPSRGALGQFPGAVLMRRGSDFKFVHFAEGDADTSIIGRALFSAADRTGDSVADVSFLTTTCNAGGCTSSVHIQSWDGSAWREAGPADGGIDNLDSATFAGTGAATRLVLHGGPTASTGSGPTRLATTTYAFDGKRFGQVSFVPATPVYLYHAILDADTKFDAGDYAGAIAAYQDAIANTNLKDWKQETGAGDGRTFLERYAYFRIAIATAAKGDDPTAALDAVISHSDDKELIFSYAAQQFRDGYQEKLSVHAGCVQVTAYLALTSANGGDNAAHIRESFFYGHANPVKTYDMVCPL